MSRHKLNLPGFHGKWSDRFVINEDGKYIPTITYLNEDSWYWQQKAEASRRYLLLTYGPEKSWDLIDVYFPGKTIEDFTWKQIYETFEKINDQLNQITHNYFMLLEGAK